MSDTELRADNERLTTLNDKLARQVIGMGEKLEAGRRELLATGWDACAKLPTRPDLKDNPYRQPVMDFSGALMCTTDGDA
ncbi:hypothetical protein [Arthrobacter sp. PsM3]|uniref:hypothetical protein n=1 Tax=Arthrobacter sp. PsM3 TaxID=3030531 RepID=UPI00263BE760|nr:hypothetical protein [Arthrobacter sp. PsM3]MDN4644946.1 hypothetical protein [Arthrobacter sp. PsM3]